VSVEVHDGFEAVAAEWDALADRARATAWLRPGWFEPWWRAFGRGRIALHAVRRSGDLVAVVALARGRGGLLTSFANWHTPEFGVLAADADARARLLEGILRGRGRRVELRFVPADDPTRDAWGDAARARRYRQLERVLERSPYIPLDGGWEAYERGLHRDFRGDVRRRRRRLEEVGHVELDVRDGSEELETVLDEGFRVEASGWKTEEGTAILSRPETERFYRDVARWAAARGILRLAFLRLDGRPLAFHFNVEDNGVHYHLKGGYEPEYRSFSPGKLMHGAMIRSSFERGLRSYEFLGSDEPWKLDWADRVRDRWILQAFPRSPIGQAESAVFTFGRPLAKRVLALAGR